MDTELDLARTLRKMDALIETARRVAEPILQRWDEEESLSEQEEAA
ncbi:hypothetical protein JKG47_17000 [Acidithiobacillus sp. MC6.1]|nr:hypothetical protein [Acidithiobacillus sp. MC6.1]